MSSQQDEIAKQKFEQSTSNFYNNVTKLLARKPISCTKKTVSGVFNGSNYANDTEKCKPEEMAEFFELAQDMALRFKNHNGLLKEELSDMGTNVDLSAYYTKKFDLKETADEKTYSLSYEPNRAKKNEGYPGFDFMFGRFNKDNMEYQCIGKAVSLDGFGMAAKLCAVDTDKFIIEVAGSMIVASASTKFEVQFK